MTSTLEFGYIQDTLSLKTLEFEVYKNPKVDTAGSGNFILKDGYVFAPNAQHRRTFDLPKNYVLAGPIESEEHGRFIIQCFGFLYGIKLTAIPYEYIDSVCLKKYGTGVVLNKKSLENGILCSNKFWDKYKKEQIVSRIFGLINILFLSKTKGLLQFERFNYLYMAIDTCYKCFLDTGKIKSDKRCSHDRRIEAISEETGVPFPQSFAKVNPSEKKKLVTILRNDIIHEGLLNGKPLGYEFFKENLLFLENYVIRLIFAALEINASGFIDTTEHAQMQGITIELA